MEKSLKDIPDTVVGDEWHSIYAESLKRCNDKITKNLDKIQKKYEAFPFSVPKSSCDVQYMAIFFCMQMDAYAVRK